jgi:hypothetical protein
MVEYLRYLCYPLGDKVWVVCIIIAPVRRRGGSLVNCKQVYWNGNINVHNSEIKLFVLITQAPMGFYTHHTTKTKQINWFFILHTNYFSYHVDYTIRVHETIQPFQLSARGRVLTSRYVCKISTSIFLSRLSHLYSSGRKGRSTACGFLPIRICMQKEYKQSETTVRPVLEGNMWLNLFPFKSDRNVSGFCFQLYR